MELDPLYVPRIVWIILAIGGLLMLIACLRE